MDIAQTDEERRQKACLAKLTWATRELATAAAAYAQWQHGTEAAKLQAYRCSFCNKWHLARAD